MLNEMTQTEKDTRFCHLYVSSERVTLTEGQQNGGSWGLVGGGGDEV